MKIMYFTATAILNELWCVYRIVETTPHVPVATVHSEQWSLAEDEQGRMPTFLDAAVSLAERM